MNMTDYKFAPPVFMTATALSLLAACAQGPGYRPPELATGEWSLEHSAAPLPSEIDRWWETFEDATLERLIHAARTDNLDVRIAAERVAEARAVRTGTAAGHRPELSAGASLDRRRLSENGAFPAGTIPGIDIYQSVHDVGFDASWELDLFGATGSRIRSADAIIDQRDAEAADAIVFVTAEVARNYLEFRGLQRRLDVARQTEAALAGQHTLVAAAYRAGDVTAEDVDNARLELERARAVTPPLEAGLRSLALALGVLIGASPDVGLTLLDESGALPALRDVSAGSRVDVLQRRPDVRAAERRLAASTYEVGAAVSNRFPRLVIGAGGGFQSLDTDTLFDAASQTFSIMPAISWNLLSGGRTRAAVMESESRMRQAALAYDAVVNAALLETEQALASYRAARERLGFLENAHAASAAAYRRAETRHAAGDLRLAALLAAELRLRAAEGEHAGAHTDAAIRLVALYKALGGGMPAEAETLAAQR